MNPPDSRVLLLVEDNLADAELVTEMLSAEAALGPFQVHHAATLAAAEQKLNADRVDVVLLDLRLPDAAGVDTVKAVIEVAPTAPIVVLTGMEDESLGSACIDAGAQDFLNKDDLKPIHLRRAIGYAITRMRESQLRETQGLLARYRSLSSHGVTTNVTASLSGIGPLRQSDPDYFYDLVREYRLLLDDYIRKLAFKTERPKPLMERLATSLGDHGAGPRDLVDAHLAALENATAKASVEQARAMVLEGRLLALEMMGLLVDFYRVGSRRRSL